jgi:hypothetical protein
VYTQISGAFDYNAMPLAPPGTKIVIDEKASVRGSWAPHGLDGWYIGPALEHYQCYHVHVNNANAERIGDTVEFFEGRWGALQDLASFHYRLLCPNAQAVIS